MALRFRPRSDRSQPLFRSTDEPPLTLSERRATTDMSKLEHTAMLAGRLIFGGYFVYSGVKHFIDREAMIGYAEGKGVAFPEVAVLGSGAMLVVGGFSLMTGVKPKLGAALITAFLSGVTPKMHDYWKATDPNARMADFINFQKNMALLGAALMLLALPRPWPYSF